MFYYIFISAEECIIIWTIYVILWTDSSILIYISFWYTIQSVL
nr:MAG TPA: hypothetical protein [Bacteriophage sp.]